MRLPALRSARTRIVASFLTILILSGILSMVALHEVLVIREDDRIEDAFGQEVSELDRLIVDGRDPTTGEPFTSLSALFDVFFARNVPSDDEGLLAFVEGRIHRASLARFPVDRVPPETLERWRTLSRGGGGSRSDADGRFDTPVGEARFRESQVAVGAETGAFVITILPAAELREIDDIRTYGIAATLLVVLAASACVWLISGRTLEPVRQLTETAHSISYSDLTQRVEVTGSGEAAEMAWSFNAMLDRLEAVLRGQREFIRDVSHELRDPLTICLGHIEILGDDPEDRRATQAIVSDELDRIGRIVDDLQRLAEAEHPDFLRVEEIDLDLLAHELTAKAGALAPRAWVLERSDAGTLVADRHRLTEAVMNLASNAVEHTGEGDEIAIGVAVDGGELRLSVRDTGVGVPRAERERIFERFARGEASRTRYRGTGLGLAIVKLIAEAHGGRVELESRLGHGATFTIVVPRRSAGGALS